MKSNANYRLFSLPGVSSAGSFVLTFINLLTNWRGGPFSEKNVAYNSKDRYLPTVTTHDTVIRVREETRYTKVFVPVTEGKEFLHFSPPFLLPLFHHLSSPLPSFTLYAVPAKLNKSGLV